MPLSIGLLAHVDAGKTTLAEALLFDAGAIRCKGRVDHRDAFFDSNTQERERGITIFSKQAELSLGDVDVMLLDTPGHVDFSAEMERTLRVMDYAILIINGRDGVQNHTHTLWRLLEEYGIPTFVWVNKMDLAAVDKMGLKQQIEKELSAACIELGTEDFYENAALCDEALLEKQLAEGILADEDIADAVKARKLFPTLYGSALKSEGIKELIEAVCRFGKEPEYGKDFAARVYKITRDERGNRLTHMKITGGTLKVKEMITTGETEEKVNQIRIFSGDKSRMVSEALPGQIVAVAGFDNSYAGQSLGAEKPGRISSLNVGRICRLSYPETVNSYKFIKSMYQLEEEQPELQLYVTEEKEVLLRIMGDVQLEVLETLILGRLGVAVRIEEYEPPVYEEEQIEIEEEIDDRVDLNSRWMPGYRGSGDENLEEELKAIFEKTYGEQKQPTVRAAVQRETVKSTIGKEEICKEYLLVDGYNVIYDWEDLRELSRINIDAAREALIEMLCSYRSWTNAEVIAVFDAYRVKGGTQRTEKYNNIYVVYTAEAESADTYIERTTYELKRRHRARVVTSDSAEQIIILSNNAVAVSASAFRKELDAVMEDIRAWMDDYKMEEYLHNLQRIKLPEEK